MANPKVNPRAYVQLQSNSPQELQKAFNYIIDNINQLQSSAAQQKLFIAAANDDLVLGIDAKTIPGTVLRLQAGTYIVFGVFDFTFTVAANNPEGLFAVDNGEGMVARTSPTAPMLITGAGVGTLEGIVTQVWSYSSVSQGTVCLQARKNNVGGVGQANKNNTQLITVKL